MPNPAQVEFHKLTRPPNRDRVASEAVPSVHWEWAPAMDGPAADFIQIPYVSAATTGYMETHKSCP